MVHSSSTVTLVVPWLVREVDRLKLYGSTTNFTSWQEQERWIRTEFISSTTEDNLHIEFYDSIYIEAIGSILPLLDIPTWIISTFCEPPTSTPSNSSGRRRRTADVAILEEPEHLNFVRYSDCHWTDRFRFVIGIIHTNYPAYVSLSAPSFLYLIPWLSEQAMIQLCNWLIQKNCHFILRLSGALPPIITNNQTNNDEHTFSRDVICNVHGVQQDFISNTTTTTSALSSTTSTSSTRQIYYIGKLLWVKGFHILLDIEQKYYQETGKYFPIDIYGSGPEEDEIKQSFLGRSTNVQEQTTTVSATTNSNIFQHSLRQLVTDHPLSATPLMPSSPTAQHLSTSSILLSATEGSVQYTAETCKAFFKLIQLPVALNKNFSYPSTSSSIPSVFFGVQRHLCLKDMPYKVFLNPSVSEVLCTTTAEALAMGKFVIIPQHISNEYFYSFRNCLTYSNIAECVQQIQYALINEPQPLSDEEAHQCTWVAATHRLLEACSQFPTKEESIENESASFSLTGWFHCEMSKHFRQLFLHSIENDQMK